MNETEIIEREMTTEEYRSESEGFIQHTLEQGNPREHEERYGFVALHQGRFIGCSSGLAYITDRGYNTWFTLTDLYVEKALRKNGIGAQLLRRLEERVSRLGIQYMFTWTAGYEAPGFYKRQGYTVMCEQENYFKSGHGRIAFRKTLAP